jgi:hypothetical protein
VLKSVCVDPVECPFLDRGRVFAVGTVVTDRPPHIRTSGFPTYGSHLGF